MTWSTVHDEMLCREILVVDPFTGTKKGTVARGTRWEEVAENLNKIQQIYFKVDKRAVRDRYNLLSKELRNKLKREEKESGIETDMTEVEMALEELIEKEDAAETEQKVVENQTRWAQETQNVAAKSVFKMAGGYFPRGGRGQITFLLCSSVTLRPKCYAVSGYCQKRSSKKDG